MIWLILLASFSLPLLLAIVAMRKRAGWVVVVLLLAAIVVMIWAIIEGQRATGWDGIGYAIVAFLGAAPAILGVLIGAGVGWVLNRQQRKKLAVPLAHD